MCTRVILDIPASYADASSPILNKATMYEAYFLFQEDSAEQQRLTAGASYHGHELLAPAIFSNRVQHLGGI